MNWGMLAGGLSRAAADTMGGVGQGLMAGEEIRRGRAQEQLQQQYLQQAQQQLTSHLAQQAFSQAMARAQLQRQQEALAEQQRYHTEALRQSGAAQSLAEQAEARKASMQPYDIAYKQAQTRYAEERPDIMLQAQQIARDRETRQAEQATERESRLREGMSLRHSEALSRINQAERRLTATQARAATMTPQQRLQMAAIQSKLRSVRQQLAMQSQWGQLGQKMPGIPSVEELTAQADDLNAQLEAMAMPGGAPAAAPAAGPQLSPRDSFMKEWGLK